MSPDPFPRSGWGLGPRLRPLREHFETGKAWSETSREVDVVQVQVPLPPGVYLRSYSIVYIVRVGGTGNEETGN